MPGFLVQVAGGLIRQEQGRFCCQRPCDRNALLLPSGKLGWLVVASFPQTDTVQGFFYLRLPG